MAKVIVRLVACAVIVALGFSAMLGLKAMRKPPRQVSTGEPALHVEVGRLYPEDSPVVMEGYGEIRSLNEVQITAEVAGPIVAIHPRLERGEVIPKGELLFRIDPRDYAASVAQAESQVAQGRETIARLQKQYEVDRIRLETLERSRTLAEREYDRAKLLLDQDDVGTQSAVDRAEMSFNQARDGYDQLSQAVELYPIRIREAESGLAAFRAQLELAEIRLGRTELYAPFDARLKEVRLEVGQYVAPGAAVLTLADDSMLEISVPLNSRDARTWLRFKDGVPADETSWVGEVEPMECRISWTEEEGAHYWKGLLHRVEEFDTQTRTVTIAVRVPSEAATAPEAGLPLVSGMFCKVEIPGRTMEGVFRLPRWAVTYEGRIHLADAGVSRVCLPAETPEARAELEEEIAAMTDAAAGPEEGMARSAEEERQVLWGLFKAFALEYSEKRSIRADTVVEWILRSDLAEDMAETAFGSDGRQISDVVEMESGFCMLKAEHRLRSVDVEVVRMQGDETCFRAGLEPGQLAVTTRLVDPLPNMLLAFEEEGPGADGVSGSEEAGS